MAKHGKKYVDTLKKAPANLVSLEEAVAFIKATPGAKFDETVDVAMHLGVDIRKSDQTVRGTVVLPNGSGKKVRVVVFAAGTHADDAKAAGAARRHATPRAALGASSSVPGSPTATGIFGQSIFPSLSFVMIISRSNETVTAYAGCAWTIAMTSGRRL